MLSSTLPSSHSSTPVRVKFQVPLNTFNKKKVLMVAFAYDDTNSSVTHESKMIKKTVLSVDLRCLKCRKKVMMKISSIEGIDSIVLDPSKNIVTVIGEADPIMIVRKVRKFRSSAHIVSVGPAKEEKKDEKKDDKKVEKKDDKKDTSAHPVVLCSTPRTCHRCDVWYVVSQDYVSPCHIL